VRTLAAVLCALAAAVACAGTAAPGDSSGNAAELGKPFTLAIGEQASLDGGKLAVRFVSVAEDSRCPKNEQCVWAGNARVDLEVRVGSATPVSVSLDTNKGAQDAEVDGYSIALEGLAPEPVGGRGIGATEYRVTLSSGRGPASGRGERPAR
jgi:hypothetical protein